MNKALSTVFMGTPDYTLPTLDQLDQLTNIAAIVTGQDKRRGRGKILTPSGPKVFGKNKNIQVWQPDSCKDSQFIDLIKEIRPDLLVVIAYGHILPQELLDVPKLMAINLHASLLPKYRGASPIQSALLAGESNTGITVQEMVLELDAGDILWVEPVELLPDDDCVSAYGKCSLASAKSLYDFITALEDGKIKAKAQEENHVSFCRKIKKTDAKVNWKESAVDIHNKRRGYSMWPKAFCEYDGKRIVLHGTEVVDFSKKSNKPGEILEIDKYKCYVSTGEGTLNITRIQVSGKGIASIEEFVNGYHPKVGDYFI